MLAKKKKNPTFRDPAKCFSYVSVVSSFPGISLSEVAGIWCQCGSWFSLYVIFTVIRRGEKEKAQAERSSPPVAQQLPGRAGPVFPTMGFPRGPAQPCTGDFFWGLLLFREYRFSHSPMGPIFAYTSYSWKLGCCFLIINLLLDSETPYAKVCQLGAADKCC